MRLLNRLLILGVLICLISSPVMEANPGGNGDGTRDFACGGACHGDPDIAQPSSAIISVSADRDSTYAGGPLTITAEISGMELSERRLVGIFLTTGTFGVDDSPDHSGWIVISDANGGTSNYVEMHVLDSAAEVSASWSLIAPSAEGSTTFHIGIHHGGEGAARLADTSDDGGISITVGPIPENFPQLSDWTPVTQRDIGEITNLQANIVNVTAVQLEWQISGDNTIYSTTAESTSNGWEASLPAALAEGSLEYRWRLSNQDFETTSAWTTLSSDSSSSVDVNPARLLMLSLAMITAALLISLQRFMASNLVSSESDISQNESNKDRTFESPLYGLSMDDPRRPVGWTDEQWMHYGNEYVQRIGGEN
ncbi:MAG: hypothetical protein CMB72_03535 [Euryarchaeota archaeon]|nr:hypothetical protein [Euryarchaeota archaeon]